MTGIFWALVESCIEEVRECVGEVGDFGAGTVEVGIRVSKCGMVPIISYGIGRVVHYP